MKVSVVFTMKGCPHCTTIKEELNKQNIPFIERDIDEYQEEYDFNDIYDGIELIKEYIL